MQGSGDDFVVGISGDVAYGWRVEVGDVWNGWMGEREGGCRRVKLIRRCLALKRFESKYLSPELRDFEISKFRNS